MKRQVGLVRKCVLGALLSSVAWAVPGMQAQAGDLPLKAPAAEPVPFWWFHGEVEAGGRFFLNNPSRNGSAYLNQNSLAKYYEYSTIKPGLFGNINLATGTNDGLYKLVFGAKNIGYSDENYTLDASKAGEHYLSAEWDQTPHVYSTSAQTIFNGVGTNALTPRGLVNSTTYTLATLSPFLQQTDLGIRRDTGSVNYRWTPTDAWDIKADYSHMTRKGTQVDGLTGLKASPVEVPRPVDDKTQNYGLNGEYSGVAPWGKKVTFKLAYNGSTYTDTYSSYTVATPYSNDTAGLINRLSMWPSNNANAVGGTLALDLPFKSRYIGTVNYTMMRQNDAFIPMSTQSPVALPASSLNGAINTTLINNVLDTQINSDLKSKLSYRYYDYSNNTPNIYFTSWQSRDSAAATADTIHTLTPGYRKQNLSEELNWRPSREWNLNASYGYERYNYSQVDTNMTGENYGKLSADWKPTSWVTARASGYYGDRRQGTYDYLGFVGCYQFPNNCAAPLGVGRYYSSAYRQFMIDNRQRTKGNFAVDVVVAPGVTITPSFKYQDDDYGLNPANQLGVNDSRSTSWGLDAAYVVNPALSIMAAYYYEHYDQSVYNINNTNAVPVGTSAMVTTSAKYNVNTFMAGVKYAAIPDQLDFDVRYSLSRGVDSTKIYMSSGATASPTGGQFPDDMTWLQRLDATAIYRFDRALVSQLGWKGDVKAKLRYTWERNSVSNWQNDSMAPISPLVSATSMWMANDNPNYNVHMMAASLIYNW